MSTYLQVSNLVKTFTLTRKQKRAEGEKSSRKIAVNDLSFSVARGEIFGLLGPNGAGKTTTLRILSTLIRPDSGTATVDGISILDHADEVRKRITFLTSELKLEDFFTPNYLFDFFARLHGVDSSTARQRKEQLFERFEITKFADVKVANLSTGMKQKTSLAVSLVHDPELIIFDEPTNGLDVITSRVVTDYLLELKEQGKTLLLSTHIFSLVERLCDRVGVLIDGQLAECGTLSDMCGDCSLEDHFFDIYREKKGATA